MEAVGKNLFAFFADAGSGGKEKKKNNISSSVSSVENIIIVHVHFGMSGVWAIYDTAMETEPETKPTTRLRLRRVLQ
jgi:formamidopyrimidine-DNA glycosylase